MKAFSRHPRLWIACAIGIASYFLLPLHSSVLSRLLASWDVGVSFYLLSIFLWMHKLTAQQICSRYIEDDASAPVLLILVTTAALLSLVAIVELLATLRNVEQQQRVWHFMLAALTLIDSWLLVPTMFTTHYARMFYSAQSGHRPLSFPQTDMPLLWDFAYFSFTIAAACQTADVLTTRTSIRRVVIAHEIISFLFNVSILGFAVNVTASLIGT